MLYEEMIRASASYADIYPAMRRLESFRSFWLRRHLLTLDFSEGERTWVERQSLDIKRTIFQNYYQDEDLEFPFKSQHPYKAEGALLDFCIHAVF